MRLLVSQTLTNGRLGGPKKKQFFFSHECIDYEIVVEQCGERQITISSPEKNTTRNLLNVYYSLDTLLMLFDGQFYSVNRALENNQDVTHSFQCRTLPSYKSADFMIDTRNI